MVFPDLSLYYGVNNFEVMSCIFSFASVFTVTTLLVILSSILPATTFFDTSTNFVIAISDLDSMCFESTNAIKQIRMYNFVGCSS